MNGAERDRAVNDLVELVHGVDALLLFQALVDVDYFVGTCGRRFTAAEIERLRATVLDAYRWQYLIVAARESRFGAVLGKLVGADRATRVRAELASIGQPVAHSRAGGPPQIAAAARNVSTAPIATDTDFA